MLREKENVFYKKRHKEIRKRQSGKDSKKKRRGKLTKAAYRYAHYEIDKEHPIKSLGA